MDTIDQIIAQVDDILATATPAPIPGNEDRIAVDPTKIETLIALLLDTYDKFAPQEYPQVQKWLADPQFHNTMTRDLLVNAPDEALIPLVVIRYLMSDKRASFPPTEVLRFKELTDYCAPMLSSPD